jgi:hypothetical protein
VAFARTEVLEEHITSTIRMTMTEAIGSSKTSVVTRAAQRHMPEDGILQVSIYTIVLMFAYCTTTAATGERETEKQKVEQDDVLSRATRGRVSMNTNNISIPISLQRNSILSSDRGSYISTLWFSAHSVVYKVGL